MTDEGGVRQVSRAAGVAGIVSVLLIFAAVLGGTRTEPPFDAAPADFLTYYRASDTPAAGWRSYLLTLGLIGFLWFVVALTMLLRRAEGELPWRSTVALASGFLLPALVLGGSEAAAHALSADLDPQLARYAFDDAHAAFGNAWVAAGSFAGCCGWVIVTTRVLARWLGWWAVVAGVGLALCRLDWTSALFLLPYLMFWSWVVTVSVVLLRRAVRTQ